MIVVNARFLTQPITGTQRFAIELCLELKQILPELKFVTPNRIIHHDIATKLNAIKIGYLKNGFAWEQLELSYYLRKNGNPLLINLCNMAPLFYSNSIVSVLDLSFYHHPEWFSPVFSAIYNSVIPRVAKHARHVLTISESSRIDIIENFGINASAIDIIYPDLPVIFKNLPEKEYNNPYGRYVLAVSSLDPRKNFKGLIQAFKRANLEQTKLVIVGAQNKIFGNNELKNEILESKSIIFTGYVSDIELIGLYKNASAFAYPSFFEGFGIPPLEAMACGCPTLVSNTTSMPEICGDASLYVDPFDVESIRAGLVCIMNDENLTANLIAKGFNQVKKFNQRVSAEKLANIIRKFS